MTRLSEIPEETLKEIQDFVKRNKGVIPVTTSPTKDGTMIETLPEAVEKKFGYKLLTEPDIRPPAGHKNIQSEGGHGNGERTRTNLRQCGHGHKESAKIL